jgi:hypothetical protein
LLAVAAVVHLLLMLLKDTAAVVRVDTGQVLEHQAVAEVQNLL